MEKKREKRSLNWALVKFDKKKDGNILLNLTKKLLNSFLIMHSKKLHHQMSERVCLSFEKVATSDKIEEARSRK